MLFRRSMVSAVTIFCVLLSAATPAHASSRPVGWYDGSPSGSQYFVACASGFHSKSLDIVITNCNYLFASNGAQAWVEVDNSNFTKKVAASTGFVHPDGTLARA